MLSEEEESKLTYLFSVTENLPPYQMHIAQTTENFQWLCKKLKEANDELKKVQSEIDRNNKVVIPEDYGRFDNS